MQIREETKSDAPAIRAVVTEAMTGLAQSTGTEAAIIARLRAENALALSLVAEGARFWAIWRPHARRSGLCRAGGVPA